MAILILAGQIAVCRHAIAGTGSSAAGLSYAC